MFKMKNATFGEKLADVVLSFLTGEVLLRVLLILVGGTLAWTILRLMLRGNYTFYYSRDRSIAFAPPLGVIGLWLLYLGVRKRSIKDTFETRPSEDKEEK